MRSYLSCSVLAVCCLPGLAAAQDTIALGDSIAHSIQPRTADSLFVTLRDGDYARFVVTHPAGVVVDVLRPDGSKIRPFITADLKGVNPVPFVAEGSGKYSVVVTNSGDAAAQYSVAFKERVSLDERMRPARDEVSSPTIENIRRQVESGDLNTRDFWSKVASGTPIIEPMDSAHDLVTFLWRAEGDVRNVYLAASFGVPGGPKNTLHQLGRSDIWYLTVVLPKGARFSYQLEPNRPASPDMPRLTRQVDPLNRGMKWLCPDGASKYRCWSVAELPDAEPQPWLAKRSHVPTGRIEKKKIHSALQDVDRGLTIYLPARYASTGTPCALVVLFDGDDYLGPQWSGPNTWDNLIAAGRIPPTVVVMVDNLPGRRLFDLVGNRTFGDFMAKELVPWVRANYNVAADARRTVVGGASAGGFGATYLGLVHPEVFGNVLSMSGAVWWSPEHNGGICAGACASPDAKPAVSNRDATTEPNWLAQLALQRPSNGARFFLSAGTFEFDQDGTAGGLLEETRHLRDILRAKNYDVMYKQFVGGHNHLGWRGLMADGLERFLGPAR